MLLFFIAAAGLFGQDALYIELCGEWRMSADDNPGYTQPDFDDGGWSRVSLPWTQAPPNGVYWLPRRLEIPAWANTSQLAVTPGSVNEAYEVYGNGQLIGRTGSFTIAGLQLARARTFDVPCGVARAADGFVLVIRVWNPPHGRTIGGWVNDLKGPILISLSILALLISFLLLRRLCSRPPREGAPGR